jgi:lysozyme family protein
MRQNGVPAIVVFALHGRESGWDFRCHLHEGSPLTHRTKYVPKNRPAAGNPPFTWEQSAEDALYILKSEQDVRWTDLAETLWAVERYNGTGYRRFHPEVPTPYLWAGTTRYTRGKYVEDGRFDRMATDKQLGCAAIFKVYLEQGGTFPLDP